MQRGRMPPAMGGVPLADELSGLVRLAFPVMVSRAGLLLMTTVDTVMTGWAGGDELAYLAIGLAPFVFLMLVGLRPADRNGGAGGTGQRCRRGRCVRPDLASGPARCRIDRPAFRCGCCD